MQVFETVFAIRTWQFVVGAAEFPAVGGGRVSGDWPALSSATVPELEIEMRVMSGEPAEQSLQIVKSGVIAFPTPSVVVTCPRRSNLMVTG